MIVSCIEHSHPVNSSGYGSCRYLGHRVGRHVKAYLEHNGMHPSELAGRVVKHSCDNRRCINPAHLSLGTQKSNLDEMVARGRQNLQVRCGEYNGNVSLTDLQVEEIRIRYIKGARFDNPNSARALSNEYGVSVALIHKIAQGVSRVRGSLIYTARPV